MLLCVGVCVAQVPAYKDTEADWDTADSIPFFSPQLSPSLLLTSSMLLLLLLLASAMVMKHKRQLHLRAQSLSLVSLGADTPTTPSYGGVSEGEGDRERGAVAAQERVGLVQK